MALLILIACAAATWFMTGLIWFVQVVHYPLFAHVGPDEFAEYHSANTRRTTWVVVGPMVTELVTAAVLVARPPAGVNIGLSWLGLLLITVCWASTGWIQVPLHGRLASGHDLKSVQRLVDTNSVRTVAWTAHALIVLVMIGQATRIG